MNEISSHNVLVKRRSFPKEASGQLRDALDAVLFLALSLHNNSPHALSAYALFAIFPRLLLRPLPNGCQGSFADAALKRQCSLYEKGEVLRLISESHEAQTERMSPSMNVASANTVTFSKTTRAAILAGAREVGRACKVALSYGIETDPEVAAKFLKNLILQTHHSHIPPHPSNLKPAKN